MGALEDGIARYNAGDFAAAEPLFRKAGPKGRSFLAHTLIALGRPHEAEKILEELGDTAGLASLRKRDGRLLAALKGKGPKALLALAQEAERRGQTAEAVKLLLRLPEKSLPVHLRGDREAAIAVDPQSAVFPGKRFRFLMKEGRFEEAFAVGERMLSAGLTVEDSRAFWNPWDWGYSAEEVKKTALPKLRKLPASPWRSYYLGSLLGEAGLTELDDIPRTPRWGWTGMKLGRELTMAGRPAEAITAFERALWHKPKDWWNEGFVAEAFLCLGKEKEALAAGDRAVRRSGEELADALAWRGELNLWLGHYERALEDLDHALRLGAPYALCWRAGALLKLGRVEEALKELEASLADNPDDREALVWKGEALRLLGREDEALKTLKGVPGAFAAINRALAGPLEREYSRLDPVVKDAVEGWGGSKRERLERALQTAKGFRRDDHRHLIWLRR